MLHKGAFICGSRSSLTQKIPGGLLKHNVMLLFPSLFCDVHPCYTTLVAAQIQKDHGLNAKFYLPLP